MEVLGAPAEVVFEFYAEGKEGAEIGEGDETVFRVQVVEEGEGACRVAEGGEVFEEGDLHFCVGEEHA